MLIRVIRSFHLLRFLSRMRRSKLSRVCSRSQKPTQSAEVQKVRWLCTATSVYHDCIALTPNRTFHIGLFTFILSSSYWIGRVIILRAHAVYQSCKTLQSVSTHQVKMDRAPTLFTLQRFRIHSFEVPNCRGFAPILRNPCWSRYAGWHESLHDCVAPSA